MTIDFTAISHALTALAAGTAALFAAPPLVAWRRKLGIETLQTVASISNQVVQSIEQTQGPASGPAKKALAINIIEGILATQGIQVTGDFLNAAIEAAVLALSKSKPPSLSIAQVPPASVTVTTASAGPSFATP